MKGSWFSSSTWSSSSTWRRRCSDSVRGPVSAPRPGPAARRHSPGAAVGAAAAAPEALRARPEAERVLPSASAAANFSWDSRFEAVLRLQVQIRQTYLKTLQGGHDGQSFA